MGLLRATLAISGLLFAFEAGAETYRWTDESGQQHFTSNLQDVPSQYRKAAGYEPERTLIHGEQSPASAASQPRSGASANPFGAVKSRIDHLGDSPRAVEQAAPSVPPKQPQRPVTAAEKYEVKCNSMGERCRKIQTQEFRDWKAREAAGEAQNESTN